MRVYEIAKEVGIPNKDLIAKIRALGLEVNNHMSSLDADDVARIKRSLEKEKQAVAQPQQTQKLATGGAVLRRRSSGDGPSETRTEARVEARPAPAVVPAPAPVVRRRVVEEAPAPAPAPVVARPAPVAVTPRPAPREEARPAPREEVHAAPAVSERPAPPREEVHAAPTPPPPAREEHRAPEPVAHRAESNGNEAARTAPVSTPITVETAPPPQAREERPEPPRPAPAPAFVPPPHASEPAAASMSAGGGAAPSAPVSTRSRVIITGPQIVARGGTSAHEAPPPRAPEPAPRPSSELPPRVTSNRPPTAPPVVPQGPRTVEEIAGTARSRFEMDLERARARTADRPPAPPTVSASGENTEEAPAAPIAPPPRDPSRPAVGTVIALPPRIKITERTPIAGRPAPGALPVNPIRGRFAQQQQRGGPRGPGGRPGFGGPGRSGPGGRPGGPGGEFGKKKLPLGKKGKQTLLTTPAEHKRVIRIEDTIIIGDLARGMGVKAPDVLKKLWGMGMSGVNINASIDFDTAQLLANEFAYEVQNVAFKEDDVFAEASEDSGPVSTRSPVVTVMGHVDHGKTSLLDSIRKARVASGEAGGITQHVAAYKVPVPGHGDIVFLDTPGHEAFTEMRARGAQATDIVVLVVAANDGVMPQTVEALSHAKDAGVRVIVAVNKIDLPDAAPERVRQQLADHGLIPEEWGGETIYVNVSALKGEGIDKLLESIAVTAEVLELQASPDKPAAGLVIEARLDRNRGPMATVLVQEGTLRVGDILVAGRIFGKVRAMLDDRGQPLKEAGPSTPVEVLGLDGVPEAGDQINVAEDDKIAKQVVEHRRQQFRKRELASTVKMSLESRMERNSVDASKELKIVLKSDVQGSAEALRAALTKQSTEKVKVVVIAAGVGGITESDVNLAKAGGAIIVGFHVRPAGKSSKLAEQEGVEIRLYDIIYDALDDVKAAMAGLLAPIKRDVAMGKLEVRDTFSIPKMGVVAGCMVLDGKINRKALLRIVRDSVQVYEGRVGSLRRFKDDVSEVGVGYECGVMVAGWNEIKVGDMIESYEVIEEAAKL